ncbi:MAG: rRNA pseudouridine synthase [Deltaproteobacteria bacterium]|nr:rRNA pseudouridine synthase [Deltaproteobacteria bacterium]
MKSPRRATTKKTTTLEGERLQKIISTAGIASRRAAELMIVDGRVRVNGKVVVDLGTRADALKDSIAVDGKLINPKTKRVYILLNKPKSYISALSDTAKRPVVVDLLKRMKTRVYPVGRLDYDAEGVLLLTNDGELANKLIHPSYGIPKKYLVKVKGHPKERTLRRLEMGVTLEDGKTLPAKVRFVRETLENSWIEMTITEGRNRLIKRMCQRVGHPVTKLKRIRFAGVGLGALKSGQWCHLTEKEVEKLRAKVGG